MDRVRATVIEPGYQVIQCIYSSHIIDRSSDLCFLAHRYQEKADVCGMLVLLSDLVAQAGTSLDCEKRLRLLRKVLLPLHRQNGTLF